MEGKPTLSLQLKHVIQKTLKRYCQLDRCKRKFCQSCSSYVDLDLWCHYLHSMQLSNLRVSNHLLIPMCD